MSDKRIIKYKTFESSSEFEEWQITNSDVSICSIQPIMTKLIPNKKGNEISVSLIIFVTYFEN